MGLRSSAVNTQLTRLRFSIILSISHSYTQQLNRYRVYCNVLGFECAETFLVL